MERNRYLLIGLALAALPFLATQFVPAVDLPQHLTQIRMLEELWGLRERTMDLAHVVVRPWGGNTLVYWPMFVIGRFLPPILLGKVTTLGIVLLSVLTLHGLAKQRGRDPALVVLASTLLFNHALYWGFLNFLWGLPIFVAFLRLALQDASQFRRPRNMLLSSLALLVLYYSHVLWLPWAGLALMLGQLRTSRDVRGYFWRFACLVPSMVLAAWWYPSLARTRSDAGFSTGAFYLVPLQERFSWEWLASTLYGGIRGWPEKVASAILIGVLCAGIARSWIERNFRDWDLTLAALGASFASFALLGPDKYMNTIFFNSRFLAIGAMLLMLAAPPLRAKWAARSLVIASAMFSIMTAVVWSVFDQDELSGLREALAEMQGPRSVLGLDYRAEGSLFASRPFLQAFAYFQAVHGGENNFSFAEHASSIVAYDAPRPIRWTPGLEWFPERVTQRDVDQFDCALVNGDEARHRWFGERFGREARASAGYFRLYCRR